MKTKDEIQRCYLPYWWQLLEQRMMQGTRFKSGLQGEEALPFPADHSIYKPFSFDMKNRGFEIDYEHLERLHNPNIPTQRLEEFYTKQTVSYIGIWSEWFARSIASESLFPDEVIKLFYSDKGISNVFITEEELEEDPARETILAEQKLLFTTIHGFSPDD